MGVENDIYHTATLETSTSPDVPYHLPPPLPHPKPPPRVLRIHVTDAQKSEYTHDESIPADISFVSHMTPLYYTTKPETSHLLSDAFTLPTSELESLLITSFTIISILANENSYHFSTPIKK